MRGIRGKTAGALELFAREFQRGLGTLALGAVDSGIGSELLDRDCEPAGEHVAHEQAAEERDRARAKNLPAHLARARLGFGEGKKADLPRRPKVRAGIQYIREEQIALVADADGGARAGV